MASATEIVFRLSRFKYGQGSMFTQPFDLVGFTVKMLWWFGCWFFFFGSSVASTGRVSRDRQAPKPPSHAPVPCSILNLRLDTQRG
jgi:hypothetical protein